MTVLQKLELIAANPNAQFYVAKCDYNAFFAYYMVNGAQVIKRIRADTFEALSYKYQLVSHYSVMITK